MTNNKKILVLEILKEVLWLCICLSIAFVLMYPIISKVKYSMIWLNALFLVVGLTYFRYAIMLRTVYVLQNKYVRFGLLIFNINFFVFVLRQEQRFMTIYDSFALADIGTPLKPLALEEVDKLFRYFYTEINFTVVLCLAMIAVLTVRFVITYWQTAYLRLNAGQEE